MEFKNGYNFIYEKTDDNGRKLYASKIGRPGDDDKAIDIGLTTEEIKATKLVYENAEGFMASEEYIPTAEDKDFIPKVDGKAVLAPAEYVDPEDNQDD